MIGTALNRLQIVALRQVAKRVGTDDIAATISVSRKSVYNALSGLRLSPRVRDRIAQLLDAVADEVA